MNFTSASGRMREIHAIVRVKGVKYWCTNSRTFSCLQYTYRSIVFLPLAVEWLSEMSFNCAPICDGE